jgi:hypothetical protein
MISSDIYKEYISLLYEIVLKYESQSGKIDFKTFFIQKGKKIAKGDIFGIKFFFNDLYFIDRFFLKKIFYFKKKYNLWENIFFFTFVFINKQGSSKIFKNGQIQKIISPFIKMKNFFYHTILWDYSISRNNFGPEFRYQTPLSTT